MPTGPSEIEFENMSREQQVIWLAADGMTDKTIAQLLGISTDTVSTYWKRIMQKYESSSRTEVVANVLKERYGNQVEKLEKEKQTLRVNLKATKDAEQQQLIATAHLNSLMNLLDVGVLFTSNGLKVTYVNEQLCQMAGCTLAPKELIGKSIETFLRDSKNRSMPHIEDSVNRIQTLVAAGTDRMVDQLVMTDGKILERTFCTLNVRGSIVGHLIVYKDVTNFVKDHVELQLRNKLSEILTLRAMAHLSSPPEMQAGEIINTLEAIANFLGADRSMIGEIDLKKGTFNIDFAWKKNRTEILAGDYQPIPLSVFPWLRKQIGEREFWIMDTMNEFPAIASMEKAVYEEDGVRSTIGISFTSTDPNKAYFVDFSYGKEHKLNRKVVESLLPIRTILGTVFQNLVRLDKKSAEPSGSAD